MAERMKPKPLAGRPTVSVVVACYNYGRFLDAAVASALDQPGVDVEVVIADNGSTDDSLDIANRLAAADSRVRVHTQRENVQNLRNFNDALALVTGEYAQVLCADDVLTPGSFTRAVAVMEELPDVVFTYGNCPAFNENVPELRSAVRSWSVWDGSEWIRALYQSGRNIIRHPEVLMRTSVLRSVGGYDCDYPLTSDMLLWMRAAARGKVARIDGPDQALYRVHGANLHLKLAPPGWLNDLKGRQKVFEALPELEPGSGVEAADILAARRALALRSLEYARDVLNSPDPQQRKLGILYARYAQETCPAVDSTRLWRRVQALSTRGPETWMRKQVGRVERKARAIVRAVETAVTKTAWTKPG